MTATRTGGFPIGFRRGWGDWQREAPGLCEWAKANDFDCIDVGGGFEQVEAVRDAGMPVGSVDLLDFKGLITADRDRRARTVEQNLELIRRCVAIDQRLFFTVMLPADPAAKRADNFDLMLRGYEPLVDLCDRHGAHIVIEGWPGPGALCCTPETVDVLFEKFDTPAIGLNYDPSHLIRLGVDPLTFVGEYAHRVFHVHGKDTEIMSDRCYLFGTEQQPAWAPGIPFGGTHWRYTLPGHGCMRWGAAFALLAQADYKGRVCIELEDANFNGSEEGEKRGLLLSRTYLEGC